MFRRVLLVGIMVLVQRGTLSQLMYATVFSLVYLLLQMQAGPFVDTGDDYLANACSFSLVVVFICSSMFKITTLTENRAVVDRMSIEQRYDFNVPADVLTYVLVGAVVGALILSSCVLIVQLDRERAQMAAEKRAAKARRLRYKKTHMEVTVPALASESHFHTFLSHVWGVRQPAVASNSAARCQSHSLLEVCSSLLDVSRGADGPGSDAHRQAAAGRDESQYRMLSRCR